MPTSVAANGIQATIRQGVHHGRSRVAIVTPATATRVATVTTITPVRCSVPCQDVPAPGPSVGNASKPSPTAITR